jgi:hypothetical protein
MELVACKPSLGKGYIKLANDIIFLEKPQMKVSNSPSWWECKLCTYSKICHQDVAPEQNCRTCANGRPAAGGLWTCKASQPFISSCPENPSECQYYTLNTKLFVDGPPF